MTSETKISKTPFDLYDIFGYIVPGLVFIVSIISIAFIFPIQLPTNWQYQDFNFDKFYQKLELIKTATPWWLEISYLILIITAIYITGHIIASISSLLIDKYLIQKTTGYPYEKLFKIEKTEFFTSGSYKIVIILINIYLLRYLFFPWYNYCELFIAIAFFGLFFLLKVIFSRIVEKNPDRVALKNRLNNIGKKLSFVFDFPVRYLEKSLGVNKPFDEVFINNFGSFFRKRFGMDLKKAETNTFWLSYCFVVDNSDQLKNIVKHFLRMHSFMRNLGTAFYLLFFFLIYAKTNNDTNKLDLIILGSIVFLISFILLTRFYYLYYNYFSKFLYRSFFMIESNNKINNNKTNPDVPSNPTNTDP